MATLSRWTVFAVLSICMFAYTYTYDIPVALQEQLQESFDISNVEYTLLFSAYAWPNCVIPILVGLLTDKIGVNVVIVVCFVICVLGNGACVLGLYYAYYPLLLIGRSVYGIGAESFVMAETPLIYEYFKGKELSFALGANLSFSRLGSSVNEITTYWFYNLQNKGQNGIIFATLMGFLLLVLCLLLLSALILHRVLFNTKDLRFDTLSKKRSITQSKQQPTGPNLEKLPIASSSNHDYNSFMSTESREKTMRDASMDSEIHSIAPKNTATVAVTTDEHDEFEEVGDDQFRLSDITRFDLRFWLLVCNTCLIYGCVEPWMKIGGSFMQSVFHYTHEEANYFLTIPYVTSAVFTPLIGYLVDRFGHRCHLLMLSALMLTAVHYLFMEGYIERALNVASLVCLGLAYSIFCGVIWPSFAVVVNPKMLGTAYGIGVAGYNLCLGLFFFVVGLLAKEDAQHPPHHDNDQDGGHENFEDFEEHKYKDVQWFLLSMALLSIFTVSMLWYFDTQKGGELKIPTMKPKVVKELAQYLNEYVDEIDDAGDDNDTVSSIGLAKIK